MQPIHGIKSSLRTLRARQAVALVLRQIRKRFPSDYVRLKETVREIQPLSEEETADGTLGEWKPLPCDPDDPGTWDQEPGVVCLAEHGDHDLIATVAEELGHACTRWIDLDRRGKMPSEEWRSELTADWYAYRWGFGRNIARSRKTRDFAHHGPRPGEQFEWNGVKYRITRRFVVHRLVN